MHQLSNGQLVKRKASEECPANYVECDCNPMICKPVFECTHRTTRRVTEACCVPYNQLECNNDDVEETDISIKACIKCEYRS